MPIEKSESLQDLEAEITPEVVELVVDRANALVRAMKNDVEFMEKKLQEISAGTSKQAVVDLLDHINDLAEYEGQLGPDHG